MSTNQLHAKLSTSGAERQVLLNPTATALWCRMQGIGRIEELYNSIADDPSIVSRIERFAKGLAALKREVII
jgi:hypothetical protein